MWLKRVVKVVFVGDSGVGKFIIFFMYIGELFSFVYFKIWGEVVYGVLWEKIIWFLKYFLICIV